MLYFALEDGPRRLPAPVNQALADVGREMAAAAEICDGMSKGRSGGAERYRAMDFNGRSAPAGDCRYARPIPQGYGAIAELQKLASKYSLGIVIVHHDRKMDADDVFDTVSGSLGLTGAADTILIMKRQASAVTLHVRGRDIEDAEKALQFDKPSCRWTILGEAADINRSAERGRVIAALKEAGGPLQAKDICDAAELRNRNATDLLLGKMVRDGEIVRADRGHYALPDTDAGQIGQKERSEISKL